MKRSNEGAAGGVHGMQGKNQLRKSKKESNMWRNGWLTVSTVAWISRRMKIIKCHKFESKAIAVFPKHSLMNSCGQWGKE